MNPALILAWLGLLTVRLAMLLDPRFFDSDEAVTGLMGLSILRGEFPFYYWGSGYPSSMEAFGVAAVLAVVPSARLATRLVPMVVHLAAVAVLAGLARKLTRSAGAAAAVVLAAALLPWPIVHFATQAVGRSLTPVIGAVIWSVFLFGSGRTQAAWLGFLFGFGFWNESSIVVMAAPVVLLWAREALARYRGRPLRFDRGMVTRGWVAVFLVAALVGVTPHLIRSHLHRGGPRPKPGYGSPAVVADRMARLCRESLPGALTSDHPFAPGKPGFAGQVAAAAALAFGLVVVGLAVPGVRRIVRGSRPDGLIGLSVWSIALLVVLWLGMGAASEYMGRRYFVFAWPGAVVLAGLGGWVLARRRPAAAWAAGTAGFVALALNWAPFRATYESWVPPTAPLIQALDAQGVRGAFANYWIANLATLDTRERIIVAQSTGQPLRHAGYYRMLAGMDRVALVFNPARFASDGALEPRLRRALAARGIRCRTVQAGEWTILIPRRGTIPVDLVDSERKHFGSG